MKIKTEIQETFTVVDGVPKATYRAVVSYIGFDLPMWCYRSSALRMLEELDPRVYHMSIHSWDKYLGYPPVGSIQRAQKIIDLLLEQVAARNEAKRIAKQKKKSKQIAYIKYP